jgi:hypothetical protein
VEAPGSRLSRDPLAALPVPPGDLRMRIAMERCGAAAGADGVTGADVVARCRVGGEGHDHRIGMGGMRWEGRVKPGLGHGAGGVM